MQVPGLPRRLNNRPHDRVEMQPGSVNARKIRILRMEDKRKLCPSQKDRFHAIPLAKSMSNPAQPLVQTRPPPRAHNLQIGRVDLVDLISRWPNYFHSPQSAKHPQLDRESRAKQRHSFQLPHTDFPHNLFHHAH